MQDRLVDVLDQLVQLRRTMRAEAEEADDYAGKLYVELMGPRELDEAVRREKALAYAACRARARHADLVSRELERILARGRALV